MDWGLFLWAWLVTTPMMLGLWVTYRWCHPNAALADVGFCVGFGLVSIGLGLLTTGDVSHRIVVAALGAGYGFRLGVYMFYARIVNAPEDSRYQLIREKLGSRAEWWAFVYFTGQALAIAVFSIPLLVLMTDPHEAWSVWEMAGVGIWIVGVGGEAVADHQLNRFRRQAYNKGKTCREGLWRYSRHPNYFFEGVHWCAYVVMSIGLSNAWLTLVGPVLMIWALLKVSGVPFAEAQALISRGDDYREYQRTTSVFIPWFPKEAKGVIFKSWG